MNKNRKLIIIRPSVVYGKGSDSNMNRMIDKKCFLIIENFTRLKACLSFVFYKESYFRPIIKKKDI